MKLRKESLWQNLCVCHSFSYIHSCRRVARFGAKGCGFIILVTVRLLIYSVLRKHAFKTSPNSIDIKPTLIYFGNHRLLSPKAELLKQKGCRKTFITEFAGTSCNSWYQSAIRKNCKMWPEWQMWQEKKSLSKWKWQFDESGIKLFVIKRIWCGPKATFPQTSQSFSHSIF